MAILHLILGCRENTSKLDPQQKDVFNNIFETIDRYNLYGKVACLLYTSDAADDP